MCLLILVNIEFLSFYVQNRDSNYKFGAFNILGARKIDSNQQKHLIRSMYFSK